MASRSELLGREAIRLISRYRFMIHNGNVVAMAKEERPMVVCPTCGGKGHIGKQKQAVDDKGNTYTVDTEEVCPQCDWVGWVPG